MILNFNSVSRNNSKLYFDYFSLPVNGIPIPEKAFKQKVEILTQVNAKRVRVKVNQFFKIVLFPSKHHYWHVVKLVCGISFNIIVDMNFQFRKQTQGAALEQFFISPNKQLIKSTQNYRSITSLNKFF